jgi:S-adenosylmethionine:diacylglycerol 3-amino-3-carboxypropyl transferase
VTRERPVAQNRVQYAQLRRLRSRPQQVVGHFRAVAGKVRERAAHGEELAEAAPAVLVALRERADADGEP